MHLVPGLLSSFLLFSMAEKKRSICLTVSFAGAARWSLQKVVLRVPAMTDDRTKQKAMEAVADIYGKYSKRSR
jgi:hypothetical protein